MHEWSILSVNFHDTGNPGSAIRCEYAVSPSRAVSADVHPVAVCRHLERCFDLGSLSMSNT